jgi:hypothetical protein
MSKNTNDAKKNAALAGMAAAVAATPTLPDTGFLHDVMALCGLARAAEQSIGEHVRAKILPAFHALPGIKADEPITAEARKTPEFKSLRDAFKRGAALYYQANISAGEGEVGAVAAWEMGKTSAAYKAMSAGEREVYDRVADRVAGYVDTMFNRHVVGAFPKAEAAPSAGKAGGKGKAETGEGGETVPMTPETLAHAVSWAMLIQTVERKAAGEDCAEAANGLAALIKAAQAATKRVAARAKQAA